MPNQVEIVDGLSKDSTIAEAMRYPVEVFLEPQRNLARARNIGVKNSRNDIIAFTDSDCVPDRTWIKRIDDCFRRNSTTVGVGGRILPTTPRNHIEAFSGNVFINEIMQFPLQMQRSCSKFLRGSFTTANCAYRRESLLGIGGFSEFFRNNGEDIDLYWRMIERFPGRLQYDPSIIVLHSFPDTYVRLTKKYFQYGVASSKLAKYHLKTPRIDPDIYRKYAKAIIGSMNHSHERGVNSLYLVQLTSHILGKIYGSVLVRALNF